MKIEIYHKKINEKQLLKGQEIDNLLQMVENIISPMPLGTFSEIAKYLDVSRETVRIHAKKLNIDKKRAKYKECKQCKKIFIKKYRNLFCSTKCRNTYHKEHIKKYYTTYTCDVCGKKKEMLTSRNSFNKKHFCSKKCQGKYMGTLK